jgi:hypothetical protein
MLYAETIVVYSENHTEHQKTLCADNMQSVVWKQVKVKVKLSPCLTN